MGSVTDFLLANYLRDLGDLLKREALDARTTRDQACKEDQSFEQGRLMAFCEVLSLMREQAIAFGLEPAALSLDDFEPERDLL